MDDDARMIRGVILDTIQQTPGLFTTQIQTKLQTRRWPRTTIRRTMWELRDQGYLCIIPTHPCPPDGYTWYLDTDV